MPTINQLLSLPYSLRVATKDFHPTDHISFDTSHAAPNNKPFKSSVMITNPLNPRESQDIPIWPVHCVQGTKGAEIIPELDTSKIDVIVEKGKEKGVEMFSAFADVFGNKNGAASLDLTALLKSKAIDSVHVVGLAGDFCVRYTALDARKEGFQVLVVDEGTRSVNTGRQGWEATLKEFQTFNIKVVSIHDTEIQDLARQRQGSSK